MVNHNYNSNNKGPKLKKTYTPIKHRLNLFKINRTGLFFLQTQRKTFCFRGTIFPMFEEKWQRMTNFQCFVLKKSKHFTLIGQFSVQQYQRPSFSVNDWTDLTCGLEPGKLYWRAVQLNNTNTTTLLNKQITLMSKLSKLWGMRWYSRVDGGLLMMQLPPINILSSTADLCFSARASNLQTRIGEKTNIILLYNRAQEAKNILADKYYWTVWHNYFLCIDHSIGAIIVFRGMFQTCLYVWI